MLTKRQVWQARQAFIRVAKLSASFRPYSPHTVECDIRAYTLEIKRLENRLVELVARGYESNGYECRRIQRDIVSYHGYLAEFKSRLVDNEKAPLLSKWLLDCGLHPYLDNGSVTFCPKGKNRRKVSHRQLMSLQRFITRNAPKEFQFVESAHLERYCLAITANARKLTVMLVHGEEVLKAYRLQVGGESCMVGEYNQFKLDLYKSNPDKIGLAIVTYRDNVKNHGQDYQKYLRETARCLVWLGEEGVMFDRRYHAGGMHNIQDSVVSVVGEFLKTKTDKPVLNRDHVTRDNGKGLRVVVNTPKDGIWPALDSMGIQTQTAEQSVLVPYACC